MRRGQPKKTGPVKKMASWARQQQQITEAADGAYALLLRADGQLTQAGQRYYSHLGLRPPSKDFDYNQPLIRKGPNNCNGLCAPCRTESAQAGQGLLPRQVLRVLVHVRPGQAAQRRAGYERRDWLPVNELGGAMTRHLTEEQVPSGSGSRWRSKTLRAGVWLQNNDP